jgi:hypothetical protein
MHSSTIRTVSLAQFAYCVAEHKSAIVTIAKVSLAARTATRSGNRPKAGGSLVLRPNAKGRSDRVSSTAAERSDFSEV